MLSSGFADEYPSKLIEHLRAIPDGIQRILDESIAREVAETYVDADAFFFVGRGYDTPVALEGSLKMKEITYKHAEGFPADELQHGPLALVTEDTPAITTITDDEPVGNTHGNVTEIQARGVPVTAVIDRHDDVTPRKQRDRQMS